MPSHRRADGRAEKTGATGASGKQGTSDALCCALALVFNPPLSPTRSLLARRVHTHMDQQTHRVKLVRTMLVWRHKSTQHGYEAQKHKEEAPTVWQE